MKISHTLPAKPDSKGPSGDFDKMVNRSFLLEIAWFSVLLIVVLSIVALNVFAQQVDRPRYNAVPASILLTNSASDVLKIRLEGNGYYDETVVRFREGATEGFDGQYDAWKLFSGNPNVPSVYTRTDKGYPLSINSLPPINTTYSVEVFAKLPAAGGYSLKSFVLGAFPEGTTILVENRKSSTLVSEEGYKTSFSDGESYDFAVSGPFTDTTVAFLVHITLPVTTGIPAREPQTGKLDIRTSAPGLYTLALPEDAQTAYELLILDMSGKTVLHRPHNEAGSIAVADLRTLASGLYIVRAVGKDRAVYSGKIIR